MHGIEGIRTPTGVNQAPVGLESRGQGLRRSAGRIPPGRPKSPETLSFLGFLLCDIFPNTTYVPHFVQEGLFLVNAFTAILIRIPVLNEAFVPVFIRIGSNTFCGIPMVSCQCALGKRDKNERRCKSTRCMLFR